MTDAGTFDEPIDFGTAHPPVVWLIIAGAFEIASLVLAPSSNNGMHAVGYALAFAAIMVVLVFVLVDIRRKADPGYLSWKAVPVAQAAIVLSSLVLLGFHTWPIATEWARIA